MTELTITPNIAKKCATISGRIAAGEHVAVTIAGVKLLNTATLQLRVIAGSTTIAMFPAPVEEGGTPAAWTESGNDLTCELNLNTVQALAQCRAPETYCLFALEEMGDASQTPERCPQLYFVAPHPVLCWPKKKPSDTPFDFDDYPSTFKTWMWQISNIAASVTKSGTVATISITDKNGITTTATVTDGAKGDKGDPGDPGSIPPGGSTGQVLAKKSAANWDMEWKTGGGVCDYDELDHRPQVNGHTLTGNKSASDLELVAAEQGKGLSSNDYTSAEKMKLSGIAAGAEVNVQSDWTQANQSADDFIKNKPTLANVATSGSYDDLSNKPSIPSVPGDVGAMAADNGTATNPTLRSTGVTSQTIINILDPYSYESGMMMRLQIECGGWTDSYYDIPFDGDDHTFAMRDWVTGQLADYPTTTAMNTAIASHHDSQKADVTELPYSVTSESTYPNRTVKCITVSSGTTVSVTLPTLPTSGSAVYNFDVIINATALSADAQLSLTSSDTVCYAGGTAVTVKAGARTVVDVVGIPNDAWYVMAATEMKPLTTNTQSA